MDTANQEINEEDETAKKIALKSSVNVIPLAPSKAVSPYPIPQDLKLALELPKDDPKLTDPAKEYAKIISCLGEFKDVKPNHYWFLMKLLLYLDYYQCMLDMDHYSLYKQKIVQSKYKKNNVVIYVPGLSEDRPSVRPRDTVVLSQVDGNNFCITEVSFVGEKYLTTKVDSKFMEQFNEDQRFNIYFFYPAYCFNCTHYAVDRAVKFDLLPILFPTGRPASKLQQQQNFTWINPSVESNPEQQQAVIHILARSAFPAPYILFGPPGTGKTSTLVEAIGQILKKNPSNRILVCTPSNAAADEIALRLLKNSVDAHDMHRMYSMSKDCKDINEALKTCSNFPDDSAIFIPKEILITKKVVITTLMTCHRLIAHNLRENHFSYVFVDEAGQATEPETLIPMTLMSSKQQSHMGRIHGQIVIAGDPKQLGPIVQSRIAEPLLGCSMLERLMEWELYRKDTSNKFNPSYVTKLVQNYRCHPAILHIPNVLFYEGELVACGGPHTARAVNWRILPKPNFPVIFHAVEGKEERDPQSPSVFNSLEVSIVISYVKDLLSSTLGGRIVRQDEIGIVTPYRLQRQKIHDELKKNNWNDIAVGTVETFQGQERDVIIMSTVRSVLYCHSGKVHIGFLSNPKRFNVALTRAKALLIVVGNPIVLQVDKFWRSFICYCVDNGACRGSRFLIERYMSRSQMRKLLAQKHVPVSRWNPDMPIQVVEEAPIDKKTYRLPERIPNRRRRLPRETASNYDDLCDNTDCLENSENEESYDEEIFDPYLYQCYEYLNHADDDFLEENEDEDDEDDQLDMKDIFSSVDGSQVSESNSDQNDKQKDSDNLWETTSSSATTDRSDKPTKPS